MGITPQFGKGYIAAQVAAFRERVEKATLFQLQYLGEQLAAYAKEQHNYTDRTGNLTNSIAYAVVKEGKIVSYGGENQPGEGADTALKVATEYAASVPNTFSLIVVAGMNYAAYVEAKGYNVILPAELKARTDFLKVIARLQEKASKKAQEMFGV